MTVIGQDCTRLEHCFFHAKDFYDLWLVSQTFDFNHQALTDAVHRTFQRRGSAVPNEPPTGLTDEFVAAWSTQWQAFLGRERMAAAPDSLAVVVAGLRGFLLPLTEVPRVGVMWRKGGPWSDAGGDDA